MGLPKVLLDHLQKVKREYKSLNRLEIPDIFTEMNQIKLMEILKIKKENTC